MPFKKGNQYGKLNRGRKMSNEQKDKIREWSKNVDRSFYTNKNRCEKISLAKTGPNNPIWKGDCVGIKQLHEWVRRHKPKPVFCAICNKNKPIDLANISQNYKRDLDDFKWICRKCHMVEDGRLEKLKTYLPLITMRGEKSSAWKGGTPICIDCGERTGKTYRAIRCRRCYLKIKIRGPRKNAYNTLQSRTL